MVFQFFQSHANIVSGYQIVQNAQPAYKIELPPHLGPRAYLKKRNSTLYWMQYYFREPQENILPADKSVSSCKIYDHTNQQVGFMAVKPGGFFNRCTYFELRFQEEIYTMFELDFRKQGIKLPVHLHSQQIALIEMKSALSGGNKCYDIIATNERDLYAVFFLTLFYDLLRSNYPHSSFFRNPLFSINNMAWKNSYDPTFRKRHTRHRQ